MSREKEKLVDEVENIMRNEFKNTDDFDGKWVFPKTTLLPGDGPGFRLATSSLTDIKRTLARKRVIWYRYV